MQQHQHDLGPWQHGHDFAVDRSATERRAWAVVALTLVMMVAEIGAGWWWNSMALLADGWHMGTHAVAIGVSGVSYWLARRWARDARFSLGPWKIEVLGAYTSAVLLALVAASVTFESVQRLLHPAPVSYDESLVVAAIGLVVNVVSAWLLQGGHEHGAGHSHGHGHAHASGPGHDHVPPHAQGHESGLPHAHGAHGSEPGAGRALSSRHDHDHDHDAHGGHRHSAPPQHDADPANEPGIAAAAAAAAAATMTGHRHAGDTASGPTASDAIGATRTAAPAAGGRDLNREAAYTHVIADAATSVLAIVALGAGKWLGWSALDPLVGLLGAALIAWWARGLIASSATILLDREMDNPLSAEVRRRLESDGDAEVADLHLWRVGGDAFACAATLVADAPHSADTYRERLRGLPALAHVMLEVNRCRLAPAGEKPARNA